MSTFVATPICEWSVRNTGSRTHLFPKYEGMKMFPCFSDGPMFTLRWSPSPHVAPDWKCCCAFTASRGHQISSLDEDQAIWPLGKCKQWQNKTKNKCVSNFLPLGMLDSRKFECVMDASVDRNCKPANRICVWRIGEELFPNNCEKWDTQTEHAHIWTLSRP